MHSMSDKYNKRTMKGHFQAMKIILMCTNIIFQRLQMFFRVLNKVLFKGWKLGSAPGVKTELKSLVIGCI